MQTFDGKMRDLAVDIFGDDHPMAMLHPRGGLAAATRVTGWATNVDQAEGTAIDPTITRPEDIAGKQINVDTWQRAFAVARSLAKLQPRLERPTMGAHPDGFPTATWVDGDRRVLDLQLRPEGFRWCQQDEHGKRTIASDSLNDVAESMRTVFLKIW